MGTGPKMLPVVDDCAPRTTSAPLAAERAEQLAGLLKVIANPARLRLLSMIADSRTGEVCVCDLGAPLGLAPPTVSFHLKTLVDAGLLSKERRGTWVWYSLTPGRYDLILRVLSSVDELDAPHAPGGVAGSGSGFG